MGTLRNRFFVEGIVLGGMCGVVLGSLIAFQVGSERIHAARRLVGRVARRQEPDIRFELIRQ
ncbi:MAG: hypothetical protein IVW57_10330 [Ktedonobacterales bacterium]|nr:hypothetical protein [Ktedonobacterales bacterium]